MKDHQIPRANKKRPIDESSEESGSDEAADLSSSGGCTQSSPPRNNFESIEPSLSNGIFTALAVYNFTVMTPVQSAVIPLFLTNKDVCVQVCFLVVELHDDIYISSICAISS